MNEDTLQQPVIGSVLRASTVGFVCGTRSQEIVHPSFGAFVRTRHGQLNDIDVIGLIYAISIDDDPLVRQLILANNIKPSVERDQRENRMVPLEISVLSIGYIYRDMIVHSLPPRPPMSLSLVELCAADSVYAFTQRLDFLPLALSASEVPSDDLIGAAIRYASYAYPENRRYEFLVRCGREIARQLSHDLKRLEHVLALIRP